MAQEELNHYGETPGAVDLHWFRGWGERLSAWIRRPNFEPGRTDCRVFRPDKLARDALVRFGLKFPELVGQVREFLDHTERSYENLCQLLPPDGCLSCNSAQDFKDEDGYRHCWICGKRNKLPPVNLKAIDIAQGGVDESYSDLSHVILVAVNAIESNAAGAEPEKGQATRSEKGKPRRKYVKREDADRIAKEKFSRLWRDSTKSEWARQIGCDRGQVEKLPAWRRAEKRRKGWRQIATRLKGTVDPKVIEALYTSDASALGKLSAEDRDKFYSLPDQERAEIFELLTEQGRDAVS